MEIIGSLAQSLVVRRQRGGVDEEDDAFEVVRAGDVDQRVRAQLPVPGGVDEQEFLVRQVRRVVDGAVLVGSCLRPYGQGTLD